MALGQAEECVQDCTTAIRLVEQTAAALQAAPGAATEREMQAGMLGAAAGDAGGLPLAAAGGAAAAIQQEDGLEPLAAAGQIQAVDISPMSPRSDGVGTSSAHGSQQTDAATAADGETGAAPAGSASSNSVQPGHQAGAATAGGASAADAGGTTSSSGSSPSSSQEAGLLQQDSSMVANLKQLLVKLFARRAAAHVELQQLQEAADDLQAALRSGPHQGFHTLLATQLKRCILQCPVLLLALVHWHIIRSLSSQSQPCCRSLGGPPNPAPLLLPAGWCAAL